MTLDEAIAHAQEVAETAGCAECREEHQQLADWLKELKEMKEKKMDAKKCDRCKRYYDFYGAVKGRTCANGSFLVNKERARTGDYTIKKEYDLCPDCMQKLQEFMEGENE